MRFVCFDWLWLTSECNGVSLCENLYWDWLRSSWGTTMWEWVCKTLSAVSWGFLALSCSLSRVSIASCRSAVLHLSCSLRKASIVSLSHPSAVLSSCSLHRASLVSRSSAVSVARFLAVLALYFSLYQASLVSLARHTLSFLLWNSLLSKTDRYDEHVKHSTWYCQTFRLNCRKFWDRRKFMYGPTTMDNNMISFIKVIIAHV